MSNNLKNLNAVYIRRSWLSTLSPDESPNDSATGRRGFLLREDRLYLYGVMLRRSFLPCKKNRNRKLGSDYKVSGQEYGGGETSATRDSRHPASRVSSFKPTRPNGRMNSNCQSERLSRGLILPSGLPGNGLVVDPASRLRPGPQLVAKTDPIKAMETFLGTSAVQLCNYRRPSPTETGFILLLTFQSYV